MNMVIHRRTLLFALVAFTSTHAVAQGAAGDARAPRFFAAAIGSRAPTRIDIARTPELKRRIALDLRNASVSYALETIAREAGLDLAYSVTATPLDRKVSLTASGITVAAALTDVLLDTGVDVVFARNGRVMLVRREAATARVVIGSVAGRVTESETGRPITGAAVRVVGTTLGAVTGEDGRFVIARVPAGSHSVRATFIGRAPATKEVSVTNDRATELDFSMAVATLPALVIEGARARGQAEALSRQLNAPNISNVVASDQMGRFPDASAPDAVQRLPGVAIERDLGEGRYIQIRGGAARNTQVTFNGEQVPSPEGDARQIALDAVPVGILESIEVTKAITPNMDAEAVGGSVNLVTRRASDGRSFTLETSGGFGPIRDDFSGKGAFTFGNRMNGGRFGYLLSGSYSRKNFGADGIEPSYDIGDVGASDDEIEELDVRHYSLWRGRMGATASLDFRPSDQSTLFLTGVYAKLQDEEQRRRLVHVVPDGALEFAHKSRRENLTTLSLSAGGTHLLGGGFGVDYRLTFAESGEDTPFDDEIVFVREDVAFAPDLRDTDRPQTNPQGGVEGDYVFDAIEPASSKTKNRDIVGAVDLSRPYAFGAASGTLRFGAKFRQKRKDRDVVERAFELADGADDILLAGVASPFNVDGFNPGAYRLPSSLTSSSTVRGFVGRFASSLDGEDVIEADAEDYEIRERTTALYAMAEHNLTSRLLLQPGIRFERTSFDGDGFEWDSEEETLTAGNRTTDYGRWFPMMHLRYRLAEQTNVRAAFTTAIARPNFYDLVPYRVRDDEDVAIGNPDLRPTTSRNFDLLIEHFDRNVGLLSAGVFYKKLKDPIFPFTEDNDLGGETTQPRNVSSGTILGAELAVQQQLRFLPGALSGLGVYGNYTFTDSDARLPGGLETRLPGQADHVFNAALSYERRGFSGQIAMNFQDDYVLELGGDTGDAAEREEDLVVARHVQFDLSASYFFTPRAQLFADVVNLSNEPYVTYQSIATRPRQREFYETSVEIGMRIRW